MIKLKDILFESDGEELDILKPRRSGEERNKNYLVAVQKQIQDYIKKGSRGHLDLRDAPIQTLPDNLTKVGGSLYLSRSYIVELPDSLSVKGDLYLYEAPIKTLPDNLTVGGNLFLSYTPIQELPDSLSVEGDLYLRNTPLAKKYTREQLKQLLPGVKGRIGNV